MSNNEKGPGPLEFDEEGKNWKLWKQKFIANIVGSNHGKKKLEERVKIAKFLCQIGEQGVNVFNTLFDYEIDVDSDDDTFDDAREDVENDSSENGGTSAATPRTDTTIKVPKLTLKEVLAAFDEYCAGKRNLTMESFLFNKIQQKDGQNFNEFLTELKTHIKNCEFKCAECSKSYSDRMLKDRIVLGIIDSGLQGRLLQERNIKLDDIINKCRAAEMSKTCQKLIEAPKQDVNEINSNVDAVKRSNFNKQEKSSSKQHYNNNNNNAGYKQQYNNAHVNPCTRCGLPFSGQHAKYCPALKDGITCHKCGKANHFASVCKNASNRLTVREIQKEDESNTQQQQRVNSLSYERKYFDEGKNNICDCIDRCRC